MLCKSDITGHRYFLWEMGYHYDLNNCLFNYGLHRVMTECRCKPFFMPSTSSRLPLDSTLIDLRSTMNASSEVNQNVTLPFCTGTSIRRETVLTRDGIFVLLMIRLSLFQLQGQQCLRERVRQCSSTIWRFFQQTWWFSQQI